MTCRDDSIRAWYHLPGLFEFYEFYKVFLELFYTRREYFYDWCDIGSIYGAPSECLWGGGRVGYGNDDVRMVARLMSEYGISARLTFSNSLLTDEHLSDKKCNDLCEMFHEVDYNDAGKTRAQNGIIIYSDLLLDYIKRKYPNYYFVSSTTKVLTDFEDFKAELDRDEFAFVVPDFRLNHELEKLDALNAHEKSKVEFLVNECCSFTCPDRKKCYESVSKKSLGEDDGHYCKSPDAREGYVFSKAMQNQGFIGVNDIKNTYVKMGFSHFKIEGRSLGSAMILEFILYYMTKPEYQLAVREKIYLNHSLDLF